MTVFVRLITAVFLSLSLVGCTSLASRKNSIEAPELSAKPTKQALIFQLNRDFGKLLSAKDRKIVQSSEHDALEFGRAGKGIAWKSESSNSSGVILARQPFRVGKLNCRRFEHTLQILKTTSKANGTACRQGDGVWKLIK